MKLDPVGILTTFKMSLPSWERGLKYTEEIVADFLATSLPSWERGLKSADRRKAVSTYFVAPLVGARIEIEETKKKISEKASLPSWERGLKLVQKLPNAGRLLSSLPSWERGLKLIGSGLSAPVVCRSPRGSAD